HPNPVGIDPRPRRAPPGDEPYLLEPVGPRGLERVHARPRVRKEPHQVNMELILRAETGRIDHERDLLLVADAGAGRLPAEAPDAIRPAPILRAGDGIARHGEAVDESRRAPAHLDVANGHVLLVLGPHFRGARARVLEVARPRLGPAAPSAVAGIRRVQAFEQDPPEHTDTRPGRRTASDH